MRVLVLGGSVFLSREVAARAVASGHDVVAVTRGRSGAVPEGVRHVVADREAGLPAALTGERFDVVVDVTDSPGQARAAVAAWPDAHWVYVSTVSVYADPSAVGGPDTLAAHAPAPEDVDPAGDPEAYGRLKVACELAVRRGASSWVIVRPGLIVGPGDPSGRFVYWPARMARLRADGRAGEVLAPGSPADVVQVIDVRDLARWIVLLAEARTTGLFDAVGPPTPFGTLLDAVAAGCRVRPRWRWLDRTGLEAADVRPWSGPRSLPLWLPRPEFDGTLRHDDAAARAAGLRTRPLAATAADTLAWLDATPAARVTGLTPAQEAAILAGASERVDEVAHHP